MIQLKKTYEVDSRKPSVLPKVGSFAVAIGSLGLAVTSIAPSVLAIGNIATEQGVSLDQQNSLTQDAASTNQTGQSAGSSTVNSGTAVTGTTLDSGANVSTQLDAVDGTATVLPDGTIVQDPTAITPVAPINPGSGNLSSATPTAEAAVPGATAANGNLSSATPSGGSSYEDDDDDRDEDEDEGDEDDDRDEEDDD